MLFRIVKIENFLSPFYCIQVVINEIYAAEAIPVGFYQLYRLIFAHQNHKTSAEKINFPREKCFKLVQPCAGKAREMPVFYRLFQRVQGGDA